MEGDAIMLSEKSRSLRRTSVKKRLETELKKDKSLKRLKREKHAKKPRLNKYQRRVANAKERERMKRMNEVFERLKKVVPMEQLNAEDGKDKKVSILRNAIIYINNLKQLITDCDAGLVDKDLYSQKQSHLSQSGLGKPPKNAQTSNGSSTKVKTSKRVILDPKWTNYSTQFLQNKWSSHKDTDKSDTASESSTTSVGSSSDSLLSELSLKSLPNIDELFGCTNILENACNIVTIQYQLIEDSDLNISSPCIEMENFTDISELPC